MKPSIPKGTRDFLPGEVLRRQYIFDVIREQFSRHGYQPIETPAMENLATLTGKYGEEGDRLLFKILNNGDYLKKADQEALAAGDSTALTGSIAKRGLRYDLTVPFARYVVMHRNDLAFPFKRSAMQPVWRADRPQKGRYQEFYQCDADVVGSDSLYYEAELTRLFDRVFAELNLKVVIRLNNRKILAGLAEVTGQSDKFTDLVVAIDKLDKIGMDGVKKELISRDFSDAAVARIEEVLAAKSLDDLAGPLAESAVGREGLAELTTVFEYLKSDELVNEVAFDLTLARGLNYYTGCIFEVVHSGAAYPDLRMGSIGGGGRYADLTDIFGMNNMPGVGISFGFDRIYDVLEELELFPATAATGTQVIALAFDEDGLAYAYALVQRLRATGIRADFYPEAAKMNKQMKYADQRGVPYALVIGSNEIKTGQLSLKDLRTGEQALFSEEEVVRQLRGE